MKLDNDKYYRVTINNTGEYIDCLSNMCAHLVGNVMSADYECMNYNITVMSPINNDKEYYEIKHNLCRIYKIELGQEQFKHIKHIKRSQQ